jgi:hypothetical protein
MKKLIPKAALRGLFITLVWVYPTTVDVFTSNRWILPQSNGSYAEGPLPAFEKVKMLVASLSFYWLLSSLAALRRRPDMLLTIGQPSRREVIPENAQYRRLIRFSFQE